MIDLRPYSKNFFYHEITEFQAKLGKEAPDKPLAIFNQWGGSGLKFIVKAEGEKEAMVTTLALNASASPDQRKDMATAAMLMGALVAEAAKNTGQVLL